MISVVLVILSAMSRFGELAPQCRVFFSHIAKRYGKDYEKYWEESGQMTDAQWAKELSGQIVEVSHIASSKHKLIKWSAVFTLAALSLWAGAVVALTAIPHG